MVRNDNSPLGPGTQAALGRLYHWSSGVTRVALRRAALLTFYSKLKTTGCSGKRVQPSVMRLTRPGTSKREDAPSPRVLPGLTTHWPGFHSTGLMVGTPP